ncbi:hypothetical protein FCK90_09520 [Kocuria coralli]|uniref:YokE-like PH domain-containing protein n=1 Tax=Kocuria coralli TaxID=1461025 RepID=A0A5J5KYC8_9MICC|nr:PH domain-containing protein [Kocuria coralli]KAA9393895.1 hypothetical protein FCK90_09520 [Kocuria coralli]
MAWTRSQQTFLAATSRITKPYDTQTVDLPEKLLAADEIVHEVLVGDTRSDANPFLLVTDRRVLVARRKLFRGWRVLGQAAIPEIVEAEYLPTTLSGSLQVHTRSEPTFEIVSDDRPQAELVVALLRHLISGGAPPEPVLPGPETLDGSSPAGYRASLPVEAPENITASVMCAAARGTSRCALVVTERSVLVAAPGMMGWRFEDEAPMPEVLGAETTSPASADTITIVVHLTGGRRIERHGAAGPAGRTFVAEVNRLVGEA